jgi:exonuclease III
MNIFSNSFTVVIIIRILSDLGHGSSTGMGQGSSGWVGCVSGWLTSASIVPRCSSFNPRNTVIRRTSPRSLIIALLLIGCIEEDPGPTTTTTLSGLRCGVLNVRSAVNKAASIHDVISSSRLDILALTETHIPADAPAAIRNDVAPHGFSVFHSPRVGRKKKSGGGIAIIYRSDLDVKTTTCTNFVVNSCETLCVRVVSRSQRVNLLVIYRPPPRATSTFFDELSNLIDSLSNLPGDFIICGDFNAPGTASNLIDDRLSDILQDVDLRQHVQHPTRVDKNCSNLLDLVITDACTSLKVHDLTITGMPFSDHSLVSFIFDFVTHKYNVETFKYRSLNNIDTYHFMNIMRSSQICISPPSLVNDFADQLDSDVTAALDIVAPIRSRTKRVSLRRTPVWMTSTAKDLKRHSRQLERRYRATGRESDYVAWRRAGRAVVREMNEARRKHFKDRVEVAGSTPAELWRVVKNLLHSASERAVLDSVTAKSRADAFLMFFRSKLEKIRCDIQVKLSNTVINFTVPTTVNNTVPFTDFKPVTPLEVTGLIMSRAKFSPVDKIPPILLKSCSTLFSVLISDLANLSFSQGFFPDSFKVAQVTPLIKKPSLNPDDPSSFRPISNLRSISKILERLVHCRLSKHLLSSPNFSTLQSAYRTFHSTETTLAKITNDIFRTVDSGSPSVLVALDLSSAFDCVSHEKLLHRLTDDFGVCNVAHAWLTSYLSGRTYFVKVESGISDTVFVNSGVPQGSVLGPLLFTTYISPIQRVIESFGINHVAYADDLTLYVNLQGDVKSILLSVSNCTNAVSNWFMLNDLLLNPSKSEAMFLGTRQQVKSISSEQVTVAEAIVQPASHVKLLGVTFDPTLSFNDHVADVCKSTFYHVKALKHIRKCIDFSTANTIACSFTASRLDYCNCVYAGMSEYNIKRLQRVQNSVARIVKMKHNRVNALETLKELHWLPIAYRIDYKISVMTHKILSSGQPLYLRSLLQPVSSARSLRSSSNGLTLTVPFCKTATAARAFSHYAPRLWNSLPVSIRNCVSIESETDDGSLQKFKRLLKTYLFTLAFDGVV